MTQPSSRLGTLALALAAGIGLGPSALLPRAAAQITSASDQALAAQMVDNSPKTRHLAPHNTFYVLGYVSVKTDKGVEGFDPGQEVHLVEVHRDSHTLVVTNGRAQVELPPSALTNDMDIAALVRQKDEAGQARIAQHVKDEQAAYARFEREAAESTSRDLAQRRDDQRKQEEKTRREEQTPVAQVATPTPYPNNGYYNDGGYGYGSPYSYFSGPTGVIVAPGTNTTAPWAPAAPGGGRAAPPVNPATIGTAGRPPR